MAVSWEEYFMIHSVLHLSEDWTFTPDRGSIGFVAHCYLGYAEPLRLYSRTFYNLMRDRSSIGKPVGDLLRRLAISYSNSSSIRSKSTTQQMIYQGDPAVQFFKASLPDYEITPSKIFLESFDNSPVTSVSDSFQVKMVVSNIGILDNQPFNVSIRRTFADGAIRTYTSPTNYQAVQYQDTLTFVMYKPDSLQSFGTNFFEVSLDYDSQIDEESEENNIAILEVFVPSIGVTPLTPTEYAIVSGQPITLSALASAVDNDSRPMVFEIDTTKLFNSGLKQRVTLPPSIVGNWDVNVGKINGRDSVVYYWRVNYADAINDPKVLWGESSFTFIDNTSDGWTQRQTAQFDKNNLSSITLNQSKNRWEFQINERTNIEINTYGGGLSVEPDNHIFARINGDTYISDPNNGDCGENAVIIYRFTIEGDIIPPNTSLNRCGRDLRAYTVGIGNGTGNAVRNYINSGGEGEYYLIFTIGQVNFSSWTTEQRNIFADLGANPDIYNKLNNGYPYIILGQKGSKRGSATEIIPTSLNTPTEDFIAMREPIVTFFDQGSISSTLIGPARSWKEIYHKLTVNEGETYALEVYGVSLQGVESPNPLFTINSVSSQDISNIDVAQYPYLRLKVLLEDQNNDILPPQLKNWLVLYEGVTDGYIDVDVIGRNRYVIPPKQEGEPINLEFAFRNNTNISFGVDSLPVEYTITNTDQLTQTVIRDTIKAPGAKEIVRYNLELDTRGMGGANRLQVNVNPRVVPEVFYENNIYSIDFDVQQDNANPTLEVAFDGRQILDGEIVSPSPLISIILRDENDFAVPEDESTTVSVSLKKPCASCPFEEIDLEQPEVTWIRNNGVTRVEFMAEDLEDGIHTLQVQGQDAFGNKVAANPYSINFEVITSSSITNFFPYPNPFSTSTRFVFTLTGETIPTNMKIQIMTVSGVVVREITMDELGPIRIGNNETEYAWDGTDEFGDRLANGVYLYRVVMGDGNDDFEHRQTSADKAFKNGFGKLYILR